AFEIASGMPSFEIGLSVSSILKFEPQTHQRLKAYYRDRSSWPLCLGGEMLDLDFNVRTLDANTVTGYRFRSRWSEHLAGRDIKHCTVPGAGDFNTFEFSFAQRTTDVRARVIDGVKRTCNVEECNLFTVDLDHPGLARRNILSLRNSHELWHCSLYLKDVLLQRNRRQTLKRAACRIDRDPN